MTARAIAHGPRALAAALRKAAAAAFRAHGLAQGGLLNDWSAIVGPRLGEHTCPERLDREGRLWVRVAGPLATELQHLEPQILERIATYFGHRAVTGLRFVQGPLPPREKPGLRRPRALDRDEEAALGSDLAGMTDPSLRAALEALGRAIIGGRRRPRAGPSGDAA